MISEYLDKVRSKKPIVHCITNYVSIKDVANIILASGGKPIMADEPLDVSDITSGCDGLVLNMGMLKEYSKEAMLVAGSKANELGHPVVLDPVGVGASSYRMEFADRLLSSVKVDVIRGNISEIRTLAGLREASGVDALSGISGDDVILVKALAKNLKCVIVVSGEVDLISDGERCCFVQNGRMEMSSITGTGCQLTGLIGAFISANEEDIFMATVSAVCTMGVAGEVGYSHLLEHEGNSSYGSRIIDAVYTMNSSVLEEGARYEIR
ncbi:MAG: hydroxyethylthiazole kinase [Erysipelotrichaceae bacterium]|nr:hydroxyethylthiazole kinase [Erysipelotrichaceae bacterium]